MNKYFVITFAMLPIIVIAGVILLNVFGRDYGPPPKAEGTEKELAMYLEVREIMLTRYDGDLEPEKLMDGALEGLSETPRDPYTHINVPIDAAAQKTALAGRFFGIGVSINANEDGSIWIRGAVRDGPADKAGVKANDVIFSVDGKSCLGQSYEATQARIRGEEGTKVRLSVLRGGDPKNGTDPKAQKLDIEVTRGEIISWSVHNERIFEREGRKLGYVRVSDFHDNTFEPQLKDAVSSLTRGGAQGLVLDLRQNGGGKVDVATAMVDAFVKEKDALIVFTRSRNERNRKDDREARTRDEQAITDLPLVILVDRNSASATEIVTGALKDMGRALVVGERSFGKGIVQNIITLKTDPGYSINVTTTQYFTPLGRRVHNSSENDIGGPRTSWHQWPYGFEGRTPRAGGIRPHIEIPYRDLPELKLVARRLTLEESRLPQQAILDNDYDKEAWNAEDRMLEAALNILAGKPVNVRD
ncbi:MAG: S41 family peptidase [Planctomycetes bacterium]|nr:S41 family peptidase [Planctomycetota bacterium]